VSKAEYINLLKSCQDVVASHIIDKILWEENLAASEKDGADLAAAISLIYAPLGDETEGSGNPCRSPSPEMGRAIAKALAAHDARVSGNQPSIKEKLLAFLGSAASADLTALKTASVLEHDGYHITGFILLSTVGRSCIVDRSAVRWLDKDEWWWLMHVSKELQPKEDGQ
jgi:hypothetical protein